MSEMYRNHLPALMLHIRSPHFVIGGTAASRVYGVSWGGLRFSLCLVGTRAVAPPPRPQTHAGTAFYVLFWMQKDSLIRMHAT